MIVAIKPKQQWQQATWDDYVAMRDDDKSDRCKLFFDNQHLWVEMGAEGINHAKFGDLFAMILLVCATKFPVPPAVGRFWCLYSRVRNSKFIFLLL